MGNPDDDVPPGHPGGVGVMLARVQATLTDRRDALALALAFVAVVTVVRSWHQPSHELFAAGVGLLLVARAVALGRPLVAAHVVGSLALVLGAAVVYHAGHPTLSWAAGVAAGGVLGLPRRAPDPADAEDRRHVWALVNHTARDTLAPFVLRTDKSYVFSPDRAAAVAYRVRFGTAVASGDPVGDPASHEAALDAFLAHADASGWRVAVLGTGERGVALWRARGLRALSIGRDVVIDVDGFRLQGRTFRNLRQAVQRTRNAGVTTEVVSERDLLPEQRAELEEVIRRAGRSAQPRGFAMILDHMLDGTHPGTLVAVARDRAGRAVAFQRYASADGGRELSLDVPWRVPGAPNGVDERLIADVVQWGRMHNAVRVSLAFAAFPDLFALPERRAGQALAYRAVRSLDRYIRLESLYRFLRKFHAFDQRRYIALRPLQVLWVALAALTLEFGAGRRSRAHR